MKDKIKEQWTKWECAIRIAMLHCNTSLPPALGGLRVPLLLSLSTSAQQFSYFAVLRKHIETRKQVISFRWCIKIKRLGPS